ncbi:hypothetical protein AGLY_007913, partial [Aphis glycines]
MCSKILQYPNLVHNALSLLSLACLIIKLNETRMKRDTSSILSRKPSKATMLLSRDQNTDTERRVQMASFELDDVKIMLKKYTFAVDVHNALVDFRTQTTYETATDSVVHASHLDVSSSATNATKRQHAHAHARHHTYTGAQHGRQQRAAAAASANCARSVDRHGRRRHTHTKWCENDDRGGGNNQSAAAATATTTPPRDEWNLEAKTEIF